MNKKLDFEKIYSNTKDFIIYLAEENGDKFIYHTYPIRDKEVYFINILTIERTCKLDSCDVFISLIDDSNRKRKYSIDLDDERYAIISICNKSYTESRYTITRSIDTSNKSRLTIDLSGARGLVKKVYEKTYNPDTGVEEYKSRNIEAANSNLNRLIDDTKYFALLLTYDPEDYYLPHYKICPKINDNIVPVIICDIIVDNDELIKHPPIEFGKCIITIDTSYDDIGKITQEFVYTKKDKSDIHIYNETILMSDYDKGLVIHRSSDFCDPGMYNVTIFKNPIYDWSDGIMYNAVFDFVGCYAGSNIHIHEDIEVDVLKI